MTDPMRSRGGVSETFHNEVVARFQASDKELRSDLGAAEEEIATLRAQLAAAVRAKEEAEANAQLARALFWRLLGMQKGDLALRVAALEEGLREAADHLAIAKTLVETHEEYCEVEAYEKKARALLEEKPHAR